MATITITKTTCDQCGKEAEDAQTFEVKAVKPGTRPRRIDLCAGDAQLMEKLLSRAGSVGGGGPALTANGKRRGRPPKAVTTTVEEIEATKEAAKVEEEDVAQVEEAPKEAPKAPAKRRGRASGKKVAAPLPETQSE